MVGNLGHVTHGTQEDRVEPGESAEVVVRHHLPVGEVAVATPVEPLRLHGEAVAPGRYA